MNGKNPFVRDAQAVSRPHKLAQEALEHLRAARKLVGDTDEDLDTDEQEVKDTLSAESQYKPQPIALRT